MNRWSWRRKQITSIIVMLAGLIAMGILFWENLGSEDLFPRELTQEMMQAWCKSGDCSLLTSQGSYVTYDSDPNAEVLFEFPKGRDHQVSMAVIFMPHDSAGISKRFPPIIMGWCGDGYIRPPTLRDLDIVLPTGTTMTRSLVFSIVPANRLTRNCDPAPPPRAFMIME